MLFHAVEFHSCIENIVGCQAPVLFLAYFIDLPGVFSYLTQKTQKAQKGAITDGGYVSPAEIAEIAEIWEPSQMAGFYVGRLKARNYKKI